jgi:hypothetical protein
MCTPVSLDTSPIVMPSVREATRMAKNLVSVAATGCIL